MKHTIIIIFIFLTGIYFLGLTACERIIGYDEEEINERVATKGQTADLMSVFFDGDETGWIVGLGGTILSTTDGGEVWEYMGEVLRF